MWYVFGGVIAVLIIAAIVWGIKVLRAADTWP